MHGGQSSRLWPACYHCMTPIPRRDKHCVLTAHDGYNYVHRGEGVVGIDGGCSAEVQPHNSSRSAKPGEGGRRDKTCRELLHCSKAPPARPTHAHLILRCLSPGYIGMFNIGSQGFARCIAETRPSAIQIRLSTVHEIQNLVFEINGRRAVQSTVRHT